jgi:HK97 family phage prohead protease
MDYNIKGMERRFFSQQVEERKDSSGQTISGHAATYGHTSGSNLPWIESCSVGCFDRAIADTENDCLALIDHNPSKILGRRKNGSLTLRSDRVGLYFNVKLPATSYAADLLENIKTRNIRGCSFSFLPRKQTWGRNANGERTRSLDDVDLLDISAVTAPVYSSTDISSDEFNSLKPVSDFDDEDADDDSDTGRSRMIQSIICQNFPGGLNAEMRGMFAETIWKRELEQGQSARIRRMRLNSALKF